MSAIVERSTRYRVLVLGPFALERDGAPLDVDVWQHRVVTLLKLLAVAPNRQRRRDDLIDILWPEADGDTGAGNLRMLIHRLRLAFGASDPSPVLSEHGWVMLNPAYSWDLDLDQIESLVRDDGADTATLESAAALYRGEPLVEDRYEEWAIPVRERAERAWRDLCLRLAALHLDGDRAEEAVRWLERALEANPLDEQTFHRLLIALHRAGRGAEGLARYERFRELLSAELDVLPDERLRRLVEELRDTLDDAGPGIALPASESTQAPLVGRDEDLARLATMAEAVLEGHGRLLFVSGEPGAGKTRLLDEARNRLRQQGFLTVSARCHARDQGIPYYPFLEIAASLHAAAPPSLRAVATTRWPALAWLLPTPATRPGPADGPHDQYHLFSALADFMKTLAAETPVAIVLDDLQWADEGTLALWQHLARTQRNTRVFLLAAYRDVDVGRDHPLAQTLRELDRDGLSAQLALQRLGPDDTTALVAELMPDAPLGAARPAVDIEELTTYIYRRTKGNPYFIHRMVRGLGSRYRLVRSVGAGGMGRVFEAVDIETGDTVALKLIFSRAETDPRAGLRFRQESAVLEHLSHPNIVRVRHTVVDPYACCIVMDFLSGSSLAERAHAESPSLDLIRHTSQQIASALAYAHEHGVVHRDIKPENVMVAEDGHTTVTDFGIARLLQREGVSATLTATGMTLGTPLYMAPEQLEGRRVDHRADIYGLGAVIYELLTGQPPFTGDEPLTVALHTLRDDPIPPSSLDPRIPREWEDIVLRALAKDPADRFQTARAMEAAIASAPTAHRIVLTPTSDPPPAVSVGTSSIGPLRPPPTPPGRRLLPIGIRTLTAVAALAVSAFLIAASQTHRWPFNTGTPTAGSARTSAPSLQSPTGDGPGQFHGPAALALDPQDNLFVTDTGNSRIQEISPGGVPIRAWGTLGKSTVQFNTPADIAVTSHGAVYVDDRGNARIEKLTTDGRQLDQISGYTGSLVVDGKDEVFVASVPQQHLWKFSWNGDLLSDWQLTGVGGARLPFRAGIALDPQGNLLICDREHDRVLKFALTPPGGHPVLGTRLAPLAVYPHPGDPYVLSRPSDVAVDRSGNIYIADTRHDRIIKLDPSGRFLAKWGKPGDSLGQLNQPASIAVDAQGNVYVADFFNDRVQKFSPAGNPLWATSGRNPLRS